MDDRVDPPAAQDRIQGGRVGYVRLAERSAKDSVAMARRQIVDNRDGMAGIEQIGNHVGADEPGSAGDEDVGQPDTSSLAPPDGANA